MAAGAWDGYSLLTALVAADSRMGDKSAMCNMMVGECGSCITAQQHHPHMQHTPKAYKWMVEVKEEPLMPHE